MIRMSGRTSTLGLAALLLAACALFSAAPKPVPIILDTDIGTDIDDAFALALVLRSPELDLLGVTTVSGDTAARAAIAAKMLSEYGAGNVPVYAGSPGKRLPCAQCRWAAGFHAPQLHSQGAVDFLDREFTRRPGEITLLTIGPLTNLAALLKKHPDVGKKIRQIVMMGGSLRRGYSPGSGPTPEYNIAADIPAAQAVFSSGIPILMAPLDVTARLQLDAADRQKIFSRGTPLSTALAELYKLWGQPTPTLHDPMAVSLLLDPSLCQIESLAIGVDSEGFTKELRGKPANVRVALDTSPRKFIEFYLDRVAP
ncbi:MAG: nucleoside hydrolase [Acidobacteria bacterium]|nr:MAG: nucleoside hydrolase [Acidobacteriota bacterium]